MRNRIVIADDHALMLDGLVRLLGVEFEVIGTAPNGRMLVEQALRLRPDLVVLDVGMPELNGIEAARQLAKLMPELKVVFVTQQLSRAYVQAAFAAGASAYVTKQSAANELIAAIRLALAKRYYVTPLAGSEIARVVNMASERNPANLFGSSLTPRQREVLQLVAEGKTTKEISATLGISTKTVEFHRNSLMDEIGVRTIAELTRYAIAQGLTSS